jgi:single-strand DNA-binding protein
MTIPITITGNVGSDPEIKFIKDNLPLATFSFAYTPRTQKNGKWEDGETMWFRVVQFGEKAETLVDSIKKGDSVIISGVWKLSTYKNRDGQDKQALEINASSIGVVPRAPKKTSVSELPSW